MWGSPERDSSGSLWGGQGSRCRILERQGVSDASELESGPSRWVVEQQQRIPGGRSGISHFLLGHFF